MLMDSNRILRSWKRYSSKKSQRFNNLARRRWLKTTCGTINTDAKGEGVACTENDDANHSDNDSGSSTGGSTERIENEERNDMMRNDMMRNNIEAEINVSVIEFLCLNDHLLNC